MINEAYSPSEIWIKNLDSDDARKLVETPIRWLRVTRGELTLFPWVQFDTAFSHVLIERWNGLLDLSSMTATSLELHACNSVSYETLNYKGTRQLILRNQQNLRSLEFLQSLDLEILWLLAIRPRSLDMEILASSVCSNLQCVWISPASAQLLLSLSAAAPKRLFCNGTIAVMNSKIDAAQRFWDQPRVKEFMKLQKMQRDHDF